MTNTSNIKTEKVYILQKDLPNAPAGTEVSWNDTSTWSGGPYKGGRYGIWDMPSGKSQTQTWTCEDVENNPEWFKLKEKEKIEVRKFEALDYSFQYRLITTKTIPEEKYEAVKKAIEEVLNKPENKPYDTIQDKGWEIVSFKNTTHDILLLRGRDGYYRQKEHHGGNSIDYLLSMGHIAIHSVRRLSDGEVFTVGELHESKYYIDQRAIKSFYIHDKKGMMIIQSGGETELADIIKIPPKEEVKKYLERLLIGNSIDKTYLRHLIHKLSK